MNENEPTETRRAGSRPAVEGSASRAARLLARLGLACALLVVCAGFGCQSSAGRRDGQAALEAAGGAESVPARPPGDFSGVRAWDHLLALEDFGQRYGGSRGAGRARGYLRRELEKVGALVQEQRDTVTLSEQRAPQELIHLVGVLPGDSSDIVLLAASYDTPRFDGFSFVGTNESASGPALLLELARVLSLESRPYTVWFALIDGDARAFEDGQRDLGLMGSRSFAEGMRQEGIFERLRVAIFFGSVADADLTVARDLASNRALREVFWDEAVELGEEDAFSRERGMSSVRSGVSVFEETGFRRSVAIADDRYGGDAAPGLYRHTRDDTSEQCSAESLDVVGRVAQTALERITRRFHNVDIFAAFPLRGDLGVRNSWP